MNPLLNQFLILFFGISLIATTLLNLAFTFAPKAMTGFLMTLVA